MRITCRRTDVFGGVLFVAVGFRLSDELLLRFPILPIEAVSLPSKFPYKKINRLILTSDQCVKIISYWEKIIQKGICPNKSNANARANLDC